MFKSFYTLLLLIAALACNAQNTTIQKIRNIPIVQDTEDFFESYKQNKLNAQQQIIDLHNGALFVRLKTKKKSIEALRKFGRTKMADEIEQKQKSLNQEIVTAFTYHFHFCPTYFFYSDQSNKVRARAFDEIEFLNERLETDTSIHFTEKTFLTAEFGILDLDTARHIGGVHKVKEDGSIVTKKYYVRQSNLQFGALSLKSDQFIQLRDPFPFYVRTFPINDYSLLREPEVAVEMLNDNLYFYYRRVK